MSETVSSSKEASHQTDLAFAGLIGQAKALAAGQASSRELVELSIARIDATQETLNCFRVVCADEARNEAAARDATRASEHGPLHGLPVAIKDDVDLLGYSTPFGCGGDYPVAERDAELVCRLREAGAIIIGKTQAPEVGQWPFTESPAFGVTANPWNRAHTPGGSSGGAAAAVAAGLVPAAIGSDGAGSVRIPAAWTSIVGLKPQRGRISTWPDPDAFNGLTCFGPLTRSIADAALLLDAVSGSHCRDRHLPRSPQERYSEAVTAPPEKLRIALSFATPFGVPAKVDPEIRAATKLTAMLLKELGHQVIETDPSYGLVGLGILPRGMAGVHGWLGDHAPENNEMEPRTRRHADIGRLLSGRPLRLARSAEGRMARRIGRVFENVDVVLTPTTALPPPKIGSVDGRGYWATGNAASAACPYAWAWNVIGWPGLSIPAGFTSKGLPIGSQLLGRENDEATLLALAAQMEEAASGSWQKIPPFS